LAGNTKRCKVHYRRLRRENGCFPDDITLAQALRSALECEVSGQPVRQNVEARIANVEANPGYQRLLNDLTLSEAHVFGNLCLFAEGEMQALLKLSESADEGGEHVPLAEALNAMEIEEARAPEGREYLHGISYWLVIGDHLYQIQHVAIQAKALEEYLTWLLRDQTQIIKSDEFVLLDSTFDRAQIGQDLGDIKSVEVGGLIPDTIHPDEAKGSEMVRDSSLLEDEVETHSTLADRLAAGMQKSRKILEELVGTLEAARIIESIPDEASLEVTVNIGYRATKRRFSKEFMSNLANGLRNIPDGEIRVRGKNGEIKGDDARLSADMGVRKVRDGSALLDLEHAEEQLLEVHRRFVHDGKISLEK